jgi:hypothetical protein
MKFRITGWNHRSGITGCFQLYPGLEMYGVHINLAVSTSTRDAASGGNTLRASVTLYTVKHAENIINKITIN